MYSNKQDWATVQSYIRERDIWSRSTHQAAARHINRWKNGRVQSLGKYGKGSNNDEIEQLYSNEAITV